MAEGHRMTAADLVDKLLADEHADVLRDSVAGWSTELMEAEVAALTGAELGERAPDRARPSATATGLGAGTPGSGSWSWPSPGCGPGSYFPSFLEPRRRAEQALVAVVQEAYVNGISTRKVDRLVEQLGLQGMSKDTVSRLCRGLDEQVRVFRERPLEGAYPYLWLDAKVERVREPGGVRHKALVIAYGVHETGRREVVGLDVGEAETESFWRAFLRSLRARGLDGVQLVVSDAHTGLRPRSPRCWAAPGSGAPSTSSGTCSATSTGPSSRWCRARSAGSSPPPRPPRPASGWARSSTSSARTRPRSPGCWRTPRLTCWRSMSSQRALVQVALHQPPGAGQPRDRPPHRRRRDLPQRRRPAAAGRDAAAGAERRVAGRPPLPIGVLHGPGPRQRRRPPKTTTKGGAGTHRIMTGRSSTDDHQLHHEMRLDSSEGANLFLSPSLKPRQLSSALPSKAATTEGRIWTEDSPPSLCHLRSRHDQRKGCMSMALSRPSLIRRRFAPLGLVWQDSAA